MSSPISALGSATFRPPSSPIALQAQLARAEAQLADCETCGSADTSQGRARTQAAARRVQALRLELEASRAARVRAPEVEAQTPTPAPGSLDITV